MNTTMGDNIAASTGGVFGSVIGLVTMGGILECMMYAFIGGIVGWIGKELVNYMWDRLRYLCKNRNK